MNEEVVKKIETWEDLDSVETIYKLIRREEYNMGEDFIDQNESIVVEVPFATYLLGKGLIRNQIVDDMLEACATLQDILCGYDDSYCIFPYGECSEESGMKKYHLLAMYIFEVATLRKRLFNVLKGWGYDGDEESKRYYEDEYGVKDVVLYEEDYEETNDESEYHLCNTIHDEWLWINKHSIEEVNELIMKGREREVN